MKYNFIKLRSILSKSNATLDQKTSDFIDEITKSGEIKEDKVGEVAFILETGGVEEEFKRIYRNFREPYIIISTSNNNSFAAALEIISFLKMKHLKSRLIFGSVDEIKSQLLSNENYESNFKTYSLKPNKILSGKRIARIGKPSGWLIASNVKIKDVKTMFDATLININYQELIDEIEKCEYPDDEEVLEIKKHFSDFPHLDVALNIYGAILRLVSKYQLSGLTIRCFDLIDLYKNTACLALSLLNNKGIVSSCEGDVPALISMMILKEMKADFFQANPSKVNLTNNELILAHCTIASKMCTSFSLDTHFESGLGVAIRGQLKPGKIVIFKIGNSLQNLIVFEGKIIKNMSLKTFCRTQVKVKVTGDLQGYLKNPLGNHLIISTKIDKNLLLNFCGNK